MSRGAKTTEQRAKMAVDILQTTKSICEAKLTTERIQTYSDYWNFGTSGTSPKKWCPFYHSFGAEKSEKSALSSRTHNTSEGSREETNTQAHGSRSTAAP